MLRYKSPEHCKSFLQLAPKVIGGLPVKYQFRELIPPLRASLESEATLKELNVNGVTRIGSSDISWLQGQSPILLDGFGPFGGDEHSDSEYILIKSLNKQLSLAQKTINYIVNK